MNSPHELSYSTQAQATTTVTSRVPATQYLVLNSKDRFQTSKDGNGTITVGDQPWNKFRLQRPQNLMESFATRITVSEIRFPWWIPNINALNNTFWIRAKSNASGNPLTTYKITLDDGFYTPTEIASAITAELGQYTLLHPPTVTYVTGQFVWDATGIGADYAYTLFWYDPLTNPSSPNRYLYFNSASLALTIGMEFYQVDGTRSDLSYVGSVTEALYTQYIDIVSDKLNYYTTTFDGSSDAVASKQLLARLYISDEVSMYNGYTALYAPFLIHRQFKNPKEVMWNKDAVIDWLDISIYDQYGNLVPLPTSTVTEKDENKITTTGDYPDFQITLTVSEN
jgi:hypothetical protein